MLGALSASGLSALMTVNDATDGEVFVTFVREVLAPTLREGDIVVLDNLGAHRSQAAREAVEQRGARLVFLPPYSPDMNPIERCWSKIKTALRAAKARTREALEAAILIVTVQVVWCERSGVSPASTSPANAPRHT